MTQQELWNKKFSKDEYLYGKEVNKFLSSCYNNFSKSQRILCVGEGEGRNAVFLAKKAYEVEAIDASDVGLRKLEKLAQEENTTVHTTCLDLNDWLPTKKYGACVISFLHLSKDEKLSIFPKIEASLNHQAFFIIEVFSKDQVNFSSGGPKDTDLLYSIEDIKQSLQHCVFHKLEQVEVILDEGYGHKGLASVIRVIAQKN